MALYLSEADVEQLLDMQTAIALVEEAFARLGRGRATNQPRRRARTPNGVLHVMFAADPDHGVLGLKAYTSFPGGTRFHVLLYSAEDGSLRALIEAGRLGQMRTGAASGVATRHLARADASVAAVIGSGYQAGAQVEALCLVRDLREIRCFSRTPDRLRRFCDETSARIGATVAPAASAQSAVQGADIVTTITSSSAPVIKGEWLANGAHVNAAGSNSLLKREIDDDTIRRAAVIAVDSREHVRLEAGDLLAPLERGILYPEQLRELGEIVAGTCPGRSSHGEITLFKSHGLAIEDLAVAAHVYRGALEAGRGQRLMC
jgi:alanine dehydrogenase